MDLNGSQHLIVLVALAVAVHASLEEVRTCGRSRLTDSDLILSVSADLHGGPVILKLKVV